MVRTQSVRPRHSHAERRNEESETLDAVFMGSLVREIRRRRCTQKPGVDTQRRTPGWQVLNSSNAESVLQISSLNNVFGVKGGRGSQPERKSDQKRTMISLSSSLVSMWSMLIG